MARELRGQVVTGWLVCLIVVLTIANSATGCRKPGPPIETPKEKPDGPRTLLAPRARNVEEQHLSCLKVAVGGGFFPEMCCREFQLCSSPDGPSKELWKFRRALIAAVKNRNVVANTLVTILRCLLSIVSFDKAYFKQLGCCDVLYWPFFCTS